MGGRLWAVEAARLHPPARGRFSAHPASLSFTSTYCFFDQSVMVAVGEARVQGKVFSNTFYRFLPKKMRWKCVGRGEQGGKANSGVAMVITQRVFCVDLRGEC